MVLAGGEARRTEEVADMASATETVQRWSTTELIAEFEVLGFQAPFVVVKRRSDGVVGSLQFGGSPRWYFGWMEDV